MNLDPAPGKARGIDGWYNAWNMHCRALVISFCLTASRSSESKGGLGEVILFVVMALQFVLENLTAVPGPATVVPNGSVSRLQRNVSQQWLAKRRSWWWGALFTPCHSTKQLKTVMWGVQEQRFPALSNRDHMFPSIIYIFWWGRKRQVSWDYNATSSGIVSPRILLGSKGSHNTSDSFGSA